MLELVWREGVGFPAENIVLVVNLFGGLEAALVGFEGNAGEESEVAKAVMDACLRQDFKDLFVWIPGFNIFHVFDHFAAFVELNHDE